MCVCFFFKFNKVLLNEMSINIFVRFVFFMLYIFDVVGIVVRFFSVASHFMLLHATNANVPFC